MKRLLWLPVLALLFASSAHADEVRLADGTVLSGRLREWTGGQVAVETAHAGTVTVDAAAVVGVTTDEARAVSLTTGTQVVGRLEWKDGEQKLGDAVIRVEQIASAWTPGAQAAADPGPEAMGGEPVVPPEKEAKLAEIDAEFARKVAAAEKERQAAIDALLSDAPPPVKWSARVEVGLNGQTGNNERVAARARAEVKRETANTRQTAFVEGNLAEENDVTTAREVFGGVRAEWDLSDRLFAFANLRAEHDDFEDLEIRANATAGAGYFVVKKAEHEWKLRGGAGYQRQRFEDGTTTNDFVLELGWDYRVDVNDWLRFTNAVTYYPVVVDPIDEFVLTVEIGAELPVAGTSNWKLKASVRNDYNSFPPPTIEKLDTTYHLLLVYSLN